MNKEYFQEVRNKLEMGGSISSNELLLYLIFNIEHVLYEEDSDLLGLTATEVLENPSSFTYKSSTIRFHEEGYNKLKEQYELFLEKTDEILEEQNDKTYDSQLFRYEGEKTYWEEHLASAEKALEKLTKIEEGANFVFEGTRKELEARKDRYIEKLNQIEKPVKKTVKEYKEDLIKQYEKTIVEYEFNMEREKTMTIQDKNDLAQKIFKIIK